MTAAFQRWTAGRKAELVAQVATGLLRRDAAISEHGLSDEEFDGWCARYAAHGQRGLEVLRIQLVGREVTRTAPGVVAARRSPGVRTPARLDRRAP